MQSESALVKELSRLDKEIRAARLGILLMMGLVLAAYFIWFNLIRSAPLSEDSSSWGTFGDYFGGIINPIVAFLALYWLTRSVRIQKEELNETRMALETSADAQRQQVRLAALTALTSAIMTELRFSQERQMFISNQISSASHSSIRDITGRTMEYNEALDFLHVIHQKIISRIAEQHNYEIQIVNLLKSTQNAFKESEV